MKIGKFGYTVKIILCCLFIVLFLALTGLLFIRNPAVTDSANNAIENLQTKIDSIYNMPNPDGSDDPSAESSARFLAGVDQNETDGTTEDLDFSSGDESDSEG